MSGFYTEDFRREFEIALVLGGLAEPPLWERSRWQEFVRALEPLVGVARGKPTAEWGYSLRFGKRLKFIECTSRNWEDVPAMDGTFEVWDLLAPSNRVCSRERRCPDLYVSVSNQLALPDLEANFGASVLVAVAADLTLAGEMLDTASNQIAALISAVMLARRRRAWAFGTETGYSSAISETSWFVGGSLNREPSRAMLSEEWEQVMVSNGDSRKG